LRQNTFSRGVPKFPLARGCSPLFFRGASRFCLPAFGFPALALLFCSIATLLFGTTQAEFIYPRSGPLARTEHPKSFSHPSCFTQPAASCLSAGIPPKLVIIRFCRRPCRFKLTPSRNFTCSISFFPILVFGRRVFFDGVCRLWIHSRFGHEAVHTGPKCFRVVELEILPTSFRTLGVPSKV